MLSRPEFAQSTVEALCLNVSVWLDTAVAILGSCSGLKYLNMRVPCHLFGKNPILELLEKLSRLMALYVDLSSTVGDKQTPPIWYLARVNFLGQTDLAVGFGLVKYT